MSVIIDGLAELDRNFKKFFLDMDKAVDDAVRITAIKVQQSAVRSIRDPSIGTYVTRYTGGGKPYLHVASKEGDAPNSDTGRLIGSVDMRHHKGAKVAFVGTNIDYGFFLETVMNRPWLEPAKNKEVAFFKSNMITAINKQIEVL